MNTDMITITFPEVKLMSASSTFATWQDLFYSVMYYNIPQDSKDSDSGEVDRSGIIRGRKCEQIVFLLL